MKSEYEKLMARAWMGVILMTCLLLLSTCEKKPPERAFTLADLLIGPSEVPQGWQIESTSDQANAYIGETAIEAASITYSTTSQEENLAIQRVARFRSANEARGIYGKYFSNPLDPNPTNWEYESKIADRASLDCHDHQGREAQVCEWAGQYEEYVVSFIIWLVTDEVSLGDLEKVVRVIDARMTHFLSGAVLEN